MIPLTTPATTTFCPNCVAKGYNWHAEGSWSWDSSNPDVITCSKCGMVFPNDQYQETEKHQSTYDSTQIITYVPVDSVKCLSYEICRPSINGVIRGHKVQHMIANPMRMSAYAYALTR